MTQYDCICGGLINTSNNKKKRDGVRVLNQGIRIGIADTTTYQLILDNIGLKYQYRRVKIPMHNASASTGNRFHIFLF